jgi:hypothetical protein
MTDTPTGQNEEIPAFRISEKKVDDEWKEQMRRERAAAAAAREAPPQRAQAPAPGAPAAAAAPESMPGARPAPQAQPGQPKASAADQQAKIFMALLGSLAQQALMQLGEIPNPFTGQQELDLQGGRSTIDLLAVLQAKTKGNLSAEESQALEETIHDLKMRYIEIANEVQRHMQAEAQRAMGKGPARPGPGGTIPGPGSARRR